MSGWVSENGGGSVNLSSPPPIGNTTPNTGAFTSVTGPIYKASSSAGGTLQANNATACLQWGAGGGSNCTFDGGVTASADDAAINFSPQKTGTVTINPAAAGSINNMTIGAVTPLAVNATALTASSSFVTNGATVEFKGLNGAKYFQISGAGSTGDPQLRISTNDAADMINFVPSIIGGGTNAGILFVLGDANISDWTMVNGDLFPSQGSTGMKGGFVFIPGAAGAPTQTPDTNNAGVFPLYFDATGNKLYVYNNTGTPAWVAIN